MPAIYARQAITTKYLGPTNHRGSRIKATCQAGSLTVGWDHALDSAENHAAAIAALAHKWGWHGTWQIGATTDGYVGVMVSEGTSIEVTAAPAGVRS